MCTKVMVCHGDKTITLGEAYDDRHKAKIPQPSDCKPATFYITADGKYAVDADFVSVADLEDPNFDLSIVPKVMLK